MMKSKEFMKRHWKEATVRSASCTNQEFVVHNKTGSVTNTTLTLGLENRDQGREQVERERESGSGERTGRERERIGIRGENRWGENR